MTDASGAAGDGIPTCHPPTVDLPAKAVQCPHCHQQSLDTFFCEHCQFELPPFPEAKVPPSAAVEWGTAAISVQWSDDPSSSFEADAGPDRVRIRGINPKLWPLVKADVLARQSILLSGLPPICILEIEGGALIQAETWRHASEPDVALMPARKSIEELLVATVAASRIFSGVMSELHAAGYVWYEFDPRAVEIRNQQVRITNLDWRLFPLGRCPERLARISQKYSPPEICQFRDELIGPRTDVYHLAVELYYRLAGIESGFAGRGLEAFGFDIPPLRLFRPDIPVGIWDVLRRGLAPNVNQRPPTVAEFAGEFECVALSGAGLTTAFGAGLLTPPKRPTEGLPLPSFPVSPSPAPSFWQRIFPVAAGDLPGNSTSSEPVEPSVDIGGLTIPGRAKSALNSINQDRILVVQEMVCGRSIQILIVADGVSTARVGDGAMASGLGTEAIVESIRSQLRTLPPDSAVNWPEILERSCLVGSEAIVNAAVKIIADSESGQAHALNIPASQISDSDLMSTTALIGILDCDELHLANVGDSRAYLILDDYAEQLTVDGDVASAMLAAGVPPEQVQELGNGGKALRGCLGACRRESDRRLVCDPDRCRPQLSRWRLAPGKTVVLCTDGLVEERVFLEPRDLVEINQSAGDVTSQILAERLVEAADRRQRLPSQLEPNGYGDNIACIVIRFRNARATSN
ncbi:MAG: PP2C family serine/threonine-protein phosphatase [Planctomycetota bacterium]